MAKRHTFTAEQWLQHPVELVFAFFANPENLPRLMPPWQKARIEEASFAPPPPRPPDTARFPGIAAGSGSHVTISFRPFPYSPMRVPWEAELQDFRWNQTFCDLQVRGPFRYWRHCHSVEPATQLAANGSGIVQHGTRLVDQVQYELPLGLAGEIAHSLFIQRQLRKTFDFRHQRTAELLPMMHR